MPTAAERRREGLTAALCALRAAVPLGGGGTSGDLAFVHAAIREHADSVVWPRCKPLILEDVCQAARQTVAKSVHGDPHAFPFADDEAGGRNDGYIRKIVTSRFQDERRKRAKSGECAPGPLPYDADYAHEQIKIAQNHGALGSDAGSEVELQKALGLSVQIRIRGVAAIEAVLNRRRSDPHFLSEWRNLSTQLRKARKSVSAAATERLDPRALRKFRKFMQWLGVPPGGIPEKVTPPDDDLEDGQIAEALELLKSHGVLQRIKADGGPLAASVEAQLECVLQMLALKREPDVDVATLIGVRPDAPEFKAKRDALYKQHERTRTRILAKLAWLSDKPQRHAEEYSTIRDLMKYLRRRRAQDGQLSCQIPASGSVFRSGGALLQTGRSPMAENNEQVPTEVLEESAKLDGYQVVASATAPPVPVDATARGRMNDALAAGTLSLLAIAHDAATEFAPLGLPTIEDAGWRIERESSNPFILWVRSATENPLRCSVLTDLPALDATVLGVDDGVLVDLRSAPNELALGEMLPNDSGAPSALVLVKSGDVWTEARVLRPVPTVAAVTLPGPPIDEWLLDNNDAWLRDLANGLLRSLDATDRVAAAAVVLRFDQTHQIDEASPQTPAPLIWAASIDTRDALRLTRLAALRAEGLAADLRALLDDPDSSDPSWTAAMDRLLFERELLEGIGQLIAYARESPLLVGALADLDVLGSIIPVAFEPWEPTDPELARRAWLVSPSAWWTAHEGERCRAGWSDFDD